MQVLASSSIAALKNGMTYKLGGAFSPQRTNLSADAPRITTAVDFPASMRVGLARGTSVALGVEGAFQFRCLAPLDPHHLA